MFIIFSELLTCMLYKANGEGSFHDSKIARAAPPIDHLLFVDYVVLFRKANCLEVAALKKCLD